MTPDAKWSIAESDECTPAVAVNRLTGGRI